MDMHRFSIKTLTAVAALATLGCGGRSKTVSVPVNTKASGLNAGGIPSNCNSKDDCPKADPGYGANMAPAGVFVGWVGEPVDWRVFGIDEKTKNPDGTSSGRRMAVLLDKVPGDATITPGKGDKLASEASIQWTPDSELRGVIDIVIRDYERCLKDREDDSYCDSYDSRDKYDKRFKGIRWEVKDREKLEEELANGTVSDDTTDGVLKVSDPNCGGVKATTDSDIKTGVIGTFIKALTNPAGLVGVATTIFSSGGLSGGSGAEEDPTQC